jgi:hypothetical protein
MKKTRIWKALLYVSILLLLSGDVFAQTDVQPNYNVTVTLEGTWLEIGRQTSEYFPDVLFNGAYQFTQMFEISGITLDALMEYYNQIEPIIPQDIKDQMDGMAMGLHEIWYVPYPMAREIVIIWNFGIDMLFIPPPATQDIGCTAFAFTSKDGTYLGHNTDNNINAQGMGALIQYKPTNKDNSFFSVFSPGFVGVALAVNEKKVAITYNVGDPNKNPLPGLPALFMNRIVMAKADNLTQAVGYFVDYLDKGGYYGYQGTNLLLVDFKDSSMARLQVCSDDIKVTYGQELKPGVTYVACTNFFDDDFSPATPDTLNDSSHQRYARLMEMLPQFETYDLNTCWAILSDTNGGEPTNTTICREGGQTITTVTNVFTPEDLYNIPGPGIPCRYLAEFETPQRINHGQGFKACIRGVVTSQGKPLEKAKVELTGIPEDGIAMTIFTPEDGGFVFSDLPEGLYKIQVVRGLHVPQVKVVYYNGVDTAEVAINFPN